MPIDFFLWDYVKDQAYSNKVNTLDELKPWITAEIANVTKPMFQSI
jgi:hypothetical protein